MHFDKMLIIAVVSAYLVGCTGYSGSSTKSTDKSTKIVDRVFPKHTLYMKYKVPNGSYVLTIFDQTGMAILGNLKLSQLVFLDINSGKWHKTDVPIVPRVALKIHDNGGVAVFGHQSEGIPTSAFLAVREEQVTEHELEEPIMTWHGLEWFENGELILGDQASESLIFIEINRILKVIEADRIIKFAKIDPTKASRKRYLNKVPISRYVLNGKPYDFNFVSKKHMVFSCATLDYFEVLDLSEFRAIDRVRRRGFSHGILLASLPSGLGSEFVMAFNESRASIDLFALSNGKATLNTTEFRGSTLAALKEVTFDQSKMIDRQTAVFEVSIKDKTVWLGYGNQVLVYKFDQLDDPSGPKLKLLKINKLPIVAIQRISFFDNYRKVLISSPEEGIVLVSTIKELTDPEFKDW